MEINFTPTKIDLLTTGRTAFRAKVLPYIYFVGLFYVMPIALALFFLIFIRPIEGVYIGWMLVIPFAMYYAMRKITLQNQNAPSLKGNHRYIFAQDSISLSGPGFDNKLEWSLIDRCVRSKTTYLLYSGRTPAISIPLRVLDADQRVKLTEILASKNL